MPAVRKSNAKKSAAKKSPAKKAPAAKAKSNGGEPKGPRVPKRAPVPTQEQQQTALKMRADGKSLEDIAKRLKVKGNTALFIVRFAQVKPKDRIKGDLTGDQVVALRAEGLAWHDIAARAGLGSPTPVKKMYTAHTGEEATGKAGLPAAAPKTAKSNGSTKKGGATKKSGARSKSATRPSA